MCDQALIVRTVLREQDAADEARRALRCGGPLNRHGFGRGIEQLHAFERPGVDRDGEHTPLARPAVHADIAAEHDGQSLRDGEAQPRTAEASRHRRVRLLKRLEEPRHLLRCHADPGVANVNNERTPIPMTLEARLDPHAALAGELHGVARQVQDDLPKPRRIAEDGPGDRTQIRHVEGDALVARLAPEHRGHIGDDVRRGARHPLHRHFAGLDLRHVEQVVDEGQQMFCVAADRVHIPGTLGFGDRRIIQEIGKSQDRRHRRADLMAHVREKLAFGFARRLRRGFGIPERLLRQNSIGDVFDGADVGTNFTPAGDRRDTNAHPCSALPRCDARESGVEGAVFRHGLIPRRRGLVPFRGMDDGSPIRGFVSSRDRTERGVRVLTTARGRGDEDAQRRALRHGPEALLALTEPRRGSVERVERRVDLFRQSRQFIRPQDADP